MLQKIACAFVVLSVLSGAFSAFAEDAENWQPGLIQLKITGDPANNSTVPAWYTDLLKDALPDEWDVTAGALMAEQHFDNEKGSIKNTFLNSENTWMWENYTSYAYEGQIYLKGGVTYQFWQQVDDGAAIRINGEVVVSAGTSSGANGGSSGFFTPAADGWYDLNIMVWNYTHGTGPKEGHYGLAYSTTVTEKYTEKYLPLNAEGWLPLQDDGEGKFLRHKAAAQTAWYVSSEEGGYYEFGAEHHKTFKNVDLKYVKSAKTVLVTSTQNTGTFVFTSTALRTSADTSPGLYYWKHSGTNITFQVHEIEYGYWRGVTISATQVGSDVHVSVIGKYGLLSGSGNMNFDDHGQGGVWHTAYFDETNADICPLALEDLKLLVSSEQQWFEPEEIYLTYDGMADGVGVWDDTTENWLTEDGERTAWAARAHPTFPQDGTITVDGAKSVGNITVKCGNVVLTGDALAFRDDSTILYENDGKIRFENDVTPSFSLTLKTRELYDVTTEFAGRYNMEMSVLNIHAGACLLDETGMIDDGTASGTIKVGENVAFRFASATPHVFSRFDKVANTNGGRIDFLAGSTARLNEGATPASLVGIYGEVEVAPGHYWVFSNSPSVDVHDGGLLKMSHGYDFYGHTGAKITCHRGGVVEYLTVKAFGAADAFITIDGGTLQLSADYTNQLGEDTAGKKMTLSNGAEVTGKMMTWAWQHTSSELFVQGTSPSFFHAEKIRFGQNGQTASESARNMVEKISVADVTGDAEADFIVSSTFYLNPNTNWDNDEYCGIEKTGAGTMLLTGTNSVLAGSFKVKEGTVAFGTHASGEPATLDGMALWMQGGTVDFGTSRGSDFTELKLDADSAFVARKGAQVTFADSSAVAWTEDAQLLISGDWTKRTFRVGTSGDALTPEQLAQIKALRANGKMSAVALSGDGYLLPPWEGFNIILR